MTNGLTGSYHSRQIGDYCTRSVELSAGADVVDIAENRDVDRLSWSLSVKCHQLVTSELAQFRIRIVAVLSLLVIVDVDVRCLGL